jgi:glycerol-3-phosphate dehydrogenase
VTGVGTALDAATRGLSVALVEAIDLAAGTSSRSSKLIHGGLRYLEQLNFTLVREALKERSLLLTRLAPHLVRPVSFLYPLQHHYWERFYVGAGVLLYDTMGGARALPRHRHLSRRAALRLAPALRSDALVGAVRYYDGQVDDARHTLMTARTAARYGALLATSARATGFLRDGDRVTGIRVRDLESGGDLEVRGRQVVSAAGVWTDELTGQVGGAPFRVRMSKGIHLTVPADRIRSGTGLILPAATRADVDYLLDHVNRVLADPLGPRDVESVYVGLRPLLAGGSASTAQLSREHAVFRPAPGLVAVAGGKYTTYRVMAKDTVDEVAKGLQEETGQPVPASVTAETPLLGADGYRAAWNRRARLAARSGLDVAQVEHLLRRHGTAIDEVLGLIEELPELAEPLPAAEQYLAAEAVYAASHEGALHLDDVLVRRTRIAIEAADRGLAAADPVSEHLATVLGWTEEQRAAEVEAYRARVQAERTAETQPDDQAANTVRRSSSAAAARTCGGRPRQRRLGGREC